MRSVIILLFGLTLTLWGQFAHSVLTIEITQGADTGLPIAIVPFAWQGQQKPNQDVAAIITADLHRSGFFTPIATKKAAHTKLKPRHCRSVTSSVGNSPDTSISFLTIGFLPIQMLPIKAPETIQ